MQIILSLNYLKVLMFEKKKVTFMSSFHALLLEELDQTKDGAFLPSLDWSCSNFQASVEFKCIFVALWVMNFHPTITFPQTKHW